MTIGLLSDHLNFPATQFDTIPVSVQMPFAYVGVSDRT